MSFVLFLTLPRMPCTAFLILSEMPCIAFLILSRIENKNIIKDITKDNIINSARKLFIGINSNGGMNLNSKLVFTIFPATRSRTATLLRLHPNYQSLNRNVHEIILMFRNPFNAFNTF